VRAKLLLPVLLFAAAVAGIPTLAGAASYLDEAQRLLAKGQLRAAEIELKNAVRSDPSNMTAHYRLALVQLQLGEAAAAEHEASIARAGRYDPEKVVPLLAEAYLMQGKYRQLLQNFPADAGTAAERSRILIARGYAQLAQQHAAEAKTSFERAQHLAPNSPQPLLAEAKLLIARHQLAEAGTLLDRALRLDPKSQEAQLAKAQLLRLQGERQQALALLDEALTQSPGFLPARLERAQILLSEGRDRAAKTDIDAVLNAQPRNGGGIYLDAVLAANRKDFTKANADLQKIAGVLAAIPSGYYLQAFVQFNLHQLDQAADAARRFTARNPDNLAGHKLLGQIELSLGQPEQTINALAKFASAGKADAGALDLLGRAYTALGKSPEALAAFDKAVKRAPKNAALRAQLGATQLRTGDVAGGVKDLQESLNLAPSVPAAEMLVMTDLAASQWQEAIAVAEKLQKAEPKSPAAGNLLGLIKLARFDLDGARAQFADLAKQYPDYLPARLNLAQALALQGKVNAAEDVLEQILKQQPANAVALTRLVNILLSNGKIDAAIADAKRAHSAAPGNVGITAGLINLYLRVGRKSQALALAQQESGENTLANFPLIAARAQVEFAAGLKRDGLRTYGRLIEIAPTRIDLRRHYAAALLATGDVAKARQVIDQAMKLAPTDPQLVADRLAIEQKTAGLHAALTMAEEFQKKAPKLPTAPALIGDTYMAARQYGEAAEAYAKAFAKAPSALLALRLARAKAAAGNKDATASVLRGWLATHPHDPTVSEVLVGYDIAARRYHRAKAELEAVLAKRPRDVIALNNLAWLYQRTGDPRARVMAERAYLLSPGLPQTADTLGWILVQQGQAANAIGLLIRAGAEQKSDPAIRYHLAVALNDLGDRAAAVKILKELVKTAAVFDDKPAAQKLLVKLSKG
jgi:putative PEP-CTERM system TPR-repeat lipoprotein